MTAVPVRLLGLLIALALTATLAAAPPASAAASVNCSFTNLPGTFAPPMRAVTNGLLGGSGTYAFAGRATCWGIDANGTVIAPAPDNATIRSSGLYASTVCSTAALDGNPAVGATTIDFQQPGIADVTQLSYHVDLVGFAGPLTITRVNGRAASGGGGVVVVPDDGDCTVRDVSRFHLVGSVNFTIA